MYTVHASRALPKVCWSGAAPPWCAYILFDVELKKKQHNFTLIFQPLSHWHERARENPDASIDPNIQVDWMHCLFLQIIMNVKINLNRLGR